jgi:hypothetical protein
MAYQTAKWYFQENKTYIADNKPLTIDTLNIIQK